MDKIKELLHQKWFQVSLAVVAAAAIFVYMRNKGSAPQGASPTADASGIANVSQSLQALGQQNSILAKALGAIGTQLETDLGTLSTTLTTTFSNPAPNDMFFYQLGLKSTASCYNPVSGDLSITCYNINRGLEPNAPVTQDGNLAAGYVKSIYSTFINASTKKIDFTSVGKYLYTQGNGLANVGTPPSGGGITR